MSRLRRAITTGGRRGTAVAALVALLLAVAPPAPAQPEPAPVAGLELVDRPPWVGPEDETTFLVTTSGDLEGATIQVEVFSALDSVEELEESATEDVGVRLALAPPLGVDLLAPGPDGTQVVGLRVSADPTDTQTVQLVEPGVHPVVISLLGPDGTVLDEIRTPLVRLGDEADDWEAPDLAVLLDLAAPPSLQPDGTRAMDPSELRQVVRVGEILAAHPGLDLSVAAVPDTVDALGTLPDPAAATLLEHLRGQELLAMPYLPVPVASLIPAGLGGLIAPLVDRGEALVEDRLGVEPDRDVWAGTAPVGSEGGGLLAELGFDSIVLEGPTQAADDDLAPLPDAGPRPIQGVAPLEALMAAPVLSDELADAAGDDPDAAHVALARLLLRPVEDDPADATTTVLVRPGDLAADSVLARLLELLDAPDAPVRVGGLGLVDDEVDQHAEPVELPTAGGPDLGDVAQRVLALAGQLETFQGLIGPESSRTDELRLQIATAVATTTPPERRDAAMDVAEEVLGSAFGSVRLGGERNLNLTSRRGTLPIAIENANPFPVDVVVRLGSERLRFPDSEAPERDRPGARELPVTVEAEDVLRIDVPVEALATGSVPVSVDLWTPDQQVRLDGRQLNVRSTAISGVGVVLSLGAVAVLIVWWVRSWRRSRPEAPAGTGPGSGTAPEPME